MKLIKTTLLSFLSTAVKMASALIINKVIAIFVGPSGLAVIGQLQNAVLIINTLAQGGINSGITKYTAESGNTPKELSNLWGGALRITLACSCVTGFILVVFASQLALLILKDVKYAYVMMLFGFTVILFALNQMLISILNGLREIRTLTMVSIMQSVYALIFTSILIIFLGLDGALIGLVTNQSVVFFAVLFALRKHALIKLEIFQKKLEGQSFTKLFAFSAMAFTSAIFTPGSYLLIRNEIGNTISWDHAGYWQGMIYISSMYLLAISTALQTYYLPKLSETTDKSQIRKELKNGLRIFVPLVVAMSFCVFLAKGFLVELLFSPEFEEMKELFKWQLVGDVLKVCAFLFSFLMLAKATTVTYILSEVGFSVFFASMAITLLNLYGIVGVTYAYAINNACYLLIMIFVTKNLRK